MNYWFLALIILFVLSIGIHLAKHGEKRNEKYNFWSALMGSIIQLVLVYFAIKVGF